MIALRKFLYLKPSIYTLNKDLIRLNNTCFSNTKAIINVSVKQQSSIHTGHLKKVWKTAVSTPKQLLAQLRGSIRQNASFQGGHTFEDISPRAHKLVGGWLLACAGMTFGAVVIGGLTRLTESGLSITKWDVVTGVKPPITEEEWQIEFEKYKKTPEYKYLERDMELADFKFIYNMEWGHRVWGRLIGLVYAIPAVVFWKKGMIAKAMKKRIVIYGALIALQGVIGIVMVNSGLQEQPENNDMPRVSQYKLAAHFGAALTLYTLLLWGGLNHLLTPHTMIKTARVANICKAAHFGMAMIFFTAVSGAFVAGLDAGLVYNSWPMFADRWIPTDIMSHEPKWKNFFENHTTVQFNHRHMGEFTGLFTGGLAMVAFANKIPLRAKYASVALFMMAGIQVGLGVATLLSYVPTSLAAAHQAGSVALLSSAIWLSMELKKLPK